MRQLPRIQLRTRPHLPPDHSGTPGVNSERSGGMDEVYGATGTEYVRNAPLHPTQSAPEGTGVPRTPLALGLMGLSPAWHEPEGNWWKK